MNRKQVGDINRKRVEQFFRDHLCATNIECSAALGLSVMAIGRHVEKIRETWINSQPKRDWMIV